MKTPFAATLAGAALLSGAALAADLPAPAPMPYKAPTAVAPVYNWTGCYIAGGFGYGVWNQDHWDETSPGLVPLDPRSTNGGRGWMGLAGGGCDVEVPTGTFLGNLVFGVMADYDFMNVHGQATDMLFVSQGDLKQPRRFPRDAEPSHLHQRRVHPGTFQSVELVAFRNRRADRLYAGAHVQRLVPRRWH